MVSSNFADWQKVTFEDAFTDITAKATKVDQSEFLYSGKYPIVDQGQNFIAGYTDDEELVWGDNLPVVIFGDHTRILKYVDFPFVLGADGTKVLKPNKDILPLFAYYQLLSFDIPSAGYSRHFKFLKDYKFQYPSMEEQMRIASLLARADRLRQLRRTAHELGDALLQSVFLEMFGDGSKFDRVEFEEILEESPKNGLYLSSDQYGSGTPIIRIDAFYDGVLGNPANFKRLRATPKQIEEFNVQNDEILINRVNSIEYLGKCALVKGLQETTLFESNMMRIRINRKLAHPMYVTKYLTTPEAYAQIMQRAKKAVNQASINQQDVKSFVIPVPPLSLQEEFAGVVARVESLRGRMGESARQVEGLFESLLAESFS